MCEHGTEAMVRVKIPADLSCDGQERWKNVGIDACIATIVGALQAGGVDMRGSCCGHGQRSGHIHLQDGRGLLILSPDENADYMLRTTAQSEPASQACGCPWDGHVPACPARVTRYPCGCSAVGANVPAYCPDHREADASPAKPNGFAYDAFEGALRDFVWKRMPWPFGDVPRYAPEAGDTALAIAREVAPKLWSEMQSVGNATPTSDPIAAAVDAQITPPAYSGGRSAR